MLTPPKTFETERLLLRAPTLSDAQAIFDRYARDPLATRYVIWRPHSDIRETEAFLERCIIGWKTKTEFPWAITLKDTDQLIGMIGLRVDGFKAEVGYILARPWWGKGLMTEAVRSIVDWTLSQAPIYRVWAMCDVDNAASARVLEKAGMKREGVLRRSTIHPNESDEPRDSYCYAIVK